MTLPFPAYALYCEELPDRRAATAAHLGTRGVSPTWVRSVHGRSWGLSGGTSPGHAGLCLGHWMLWQYLWLSGVPAAVVFEDDVTLPDDFAARLERLLPTVPAGWGWVFLGLAESDELTLRKVPADSPRPAPGLCRPDHPFGTHAYMVTRPALPVLLDRMAQCRANVDIQLYEDVLAPGHLDWWACVPGLAGQRTAAGEWPTSTP